MVILLARNGQLCNRLFIVSAFVANCIENRYKMVSDSFDDYVDQFEDLEQECERVNIEFLKTNSYFKRFLYKIIGKFTYSYPSLASLFGYSPFMQNGDINIESFVNRAVKNTLVVKGWPFWDVENFVKHSATIKKIFVPKTEFEVAAINFLAKIRTNYDVLIGVHIRRGDYIHHVNGRFFFSIETYYQKMFEIYEQLMKAGKSAAFIICSNEKIENNLSIDFPYFVSDLNAMSDLVLLSKCDYIFGPPSTYSMWASFYGDVPYNNFFSADEYLPLDTFSPIVAPSTFANGRVLKDVYETYSA